MSNETSIVAAVITVITWTIYIGLYIYIGYALYVIAKKTGHRENGWMAWIPLVNFILMLQIAEKPMWWLILLFVPIVNIVISIIVWMKIAEARNKPDWWGILMLIPLVNIVIPGIIAFKDD